MKYSHADKILTIDMVNEKLKTQKVFHKLYCLDTSSAPQNLKQHKAFEYVSSGSGLCLKVKYEAIRKYVIPTNLGLLLKMKLTAEEEGTANTPPMDVFLNVHLS